MASEHDSRLAAAASAVALAVALMAEETEAKAETAAQFESAMEQQLA